MNSMSESARNWIFNSVSNFTKFIEFVTFPQSKFATFWREMWSAHFNADLLWDPKRQNVTNLSPDLLPQKNIFWDQSEIDICIEASRFVPKRCKIIVKFTHFWDDFLQLLIIFSQYVLQNLLSRMLNIWNLEDNRTTLFYTNVL